MTPSQMMTLASLIEAGIDVARRALHGTDNENNPVAIRSAIEDHAVGTIHEGIAQGTIPADFMATLAPTDIQSMLDAHPAIPNLPSPSTVSAPGVNTSLNEVYATKKDLSTAMEANNEKLIAAMQNIIAQQTANVPKQ